MMAATAKYIDDTDGALAAGGTGDALTVTTNQVLSAAHLAAGLRLLVKATASNTIAAVTFAPDGLTAAPVKRADGTALAIGQLRDGLYLDLVYNSGASEWRTMNLVPAGGSLPASFSANKATVAQNIPATTFTKVTFTTEAWDTGGYYDAATSKWTPPAGTIIISAQLRMANFNQANAIFQVLLYKNGSAYQQTFNLTGPSGSGAPPALNGVWIAQCNGTDYFEIYTQHNDVGAESLVGNPAVSFFSGSML